jgi:hypothetical protein
LRVSFEDTAEGRPPAWGKVPLLLAALQSADVVAWVDADALVLDPSQDLAGEMRAGKDLYLVEHAHPSGEVTANSGVMMLRTSRWSRRFLDRVWACEDLTDHMWWENAAIMRVLGYRIDTQPVTRGDDARLVRKVRFLDTAWNSIPHHVASPDPRIVHFAGLPLAQCFTGLLSLDTKGTST